jgi:autotransporter-associated beta strand protein
MGVALENVSTGAFVLTLAGAGNSSSWQAESFTQAQLAPYVGGTYTLDLINQYSGGWGWIALDTVSIPAVQGSSNLLPVATALSIAANATLDLSGGSQQVASLSDKTPGNGGSIINSNSAASVLTLSPTGGSTTFSGMIQGGGVPPGSGTIGLVINGSGTQVLAGSNSYSGSTAVNAGTLQATGTASLPGYASTGKITVASGGVLAVSAGGSGWTSANIASLLSSNGSGFAGGSALGIDTTPGNLSYASNIAGSMGVTKLGANSLTLGGSNTYTGGTTISQGKLVVDGCLTRSAVGVSSGGALGGTGSLTSVTVYSGGNLAPGDSLGVLKLSGNLILEQGAVMDYELDTPSSSDEISMPSGALALNLQQFSDFNFTWTSNFGPGSYPLIAFGSSSGSLGANTSGSVDGYPATLAVQGNELLLNVMVPEPSTAALFGAGAIGLLGYGLRRRRATRTAKPSAFDQQDAPAILAFPSHSSTASAVRRAA